MSIDENKVSAAEREMMISDMKRCRNERLMESDWAMLSDNGLSDEKRAEWTTYRQALRDLSTHSEWPWVPDDDLPTAPTGIHFYGILATDIAILEQNNLAGPSPEPEKDRPTVQAPRPTLPSEDVMSVWGDAYPNITIHEVNPAWSQSGDLTELILGDENGDSFQVLHINQLNWQGMNIADFGQPVILGVDVSSYSAIHMNFWLAEDNGIRFGMVSHSTPEDFTQRLITLEGKTGWNSVNISLADFDTVDMSNITQFLWDNLLSNNRTGVDSFYMDNIYFNNEAATGVTQVS